MGGGRESSEDFYYGCIFRKVKLALYTEAVILREVEVDIQEAVFASLLSVISASNASELISVSSLK